MLVECKTLRHVVASAAEAEIAGVFHNAQITVLIRRILRALNHPQPPTPVATDNSTALGIITSSIRQKRSKAMDMRFYWVKDRIELKVYGISSVGPNIKEDLVAVLQRKLDDKVLS